MNSIVSKFIAAAIIKAQIDVVVRYRQGQKGTVWIAMMTKDDVFMDLTERAIGQLGFDNRDFPPIPPLEQTFALMPCDA